MNWFLRMDRRLVDWAAEELHQIFKASADELKAEKEFWEDTLRVWIQYWPMGVAFFFGWKVFLTTVAVAVVLYILRKKLTRSKEVL